MTAQFTIGIEEEFQIVDRHTGQLRPCIHTILEKGAPIFGEKIKAEMLQSTVELVSDIYPNIATARKEMQNLRAMLDCLLQEEGLALISAGTHPTALWQNDMPSVSDRSAELEEELQDVGRSVLIFGLHVHIGLGSQELPITLINQLRNWLPHLLALSANSPFWAGRNTGLKSYRSVIWKSFPRSGVPDLFASQADLEHYVQALVNTGCIDNGKKIWWDVRPHPFFGTIEFRIFDMPSTFNDMIALVALSQALIAKLVWLHKHNMTFYTLPRHFIDENKWRAMRYGLDAEFIDFVHERRLSMRESLADLLDFVDDVLDDLGSRHEINYLRMLLEDPRGGGADRQLAIYQQIGSMDAVIQFLMQQTLEGIPHKSHSIARSGTG